MILGYSGNDAAAPIGNTVLLGTILLVIVDMVGSAFRLRRELGRAFPDEPLKGTTYYAVTRALQMKFMRLPKATGQDRPGAARAATGEPGAARAGPTAPAQPVRRCRRSWSAVRVGSRSTTSRATSSIGLSAAASSRTPAALTFS